MQTLAHQDRRLILRRFPLRDDDPLRAWDAADEYLLRHLATEGPADLGRLLLVNDGFGALAVALHAHHPVSWSDSEMARRALRINLKGNGLDPDTVPFVPATEEPAGPFDTVLLKLPKSLVFLEDLLCRLRPLLHADSVVLMGGMIKHTPVRAYRLLEKILGPTRTTLGWKKARLAVATLEAKEPPPAAPAVAVLDWAADDLRLCAGPNVFSRGRLDAGTRLLLDQLPGQEVLQTVLDVGCGYGVLALVAARRNPLARVRGVDESHQAVASARQNARRAGLDGERTTFAVAADLSAEESAAYDLIVCNPPFHQGAAVGDQLAWGMLHQARRLLKPGGRLLVVGNRHLGYHVKLRRLYDYVRVVVADRRFVVLEAGAAEAEEN
ncbi:50S rRNA methyltransferase [bacterium DOLJORAL78_65_58]|nr:MAG: 50S rRNA methyltransferase [bacterium DOLZORAL124_64_63]PIE76744.1 MAG: 50S rRNA methyltransferase [bacterium DOLJORAL78_65_58]